MAHPAHGLDLDGFELLARIGSGAMGEVWAARSRDGVDAAIKWVRVSTAAERGQALAEVRAIARLDHPCIAQVFHVGEADGAVWFAMERGRPGLDGIDLSVRVRCVLEALAHAHARGVVHRDLKPDNVVGAEGGGLRLVDFGVSALAGRTALPSAGSIPFMAPEQVRGDRLAQGPATDLYALALTVWAWVTGRSPFRRLEDQLSAVPPWEELPPSVRPWAQALLHKDPTRRPRTAAHALHLWDPEHRVTVAVAPTQTVVGTIVGTEQVLTTALAATGRFELATPTQQWLHPVVPLPTELPPPPALRLHRRHLDGGLGLLGLARPPLVARREALEALWSVVVQGAEGFVARVVTGPEGSGRRRMVGEVAELAAASGAVVWRGGTLSELVDDALGAVAPSDRRRAAQRAVHRWALPPVDAERLEAMACGGLPEGWRTTLRRALVSAGQPRVLALREASPHGPVADWVRGLGQVGVAVAVLISGEEPWPDLAQLALPSVSEDDLRRLAHAVAYVDDGAAASLAAAAGGRPGRLVALVREAAPRLRPGPHGFRLPASWAAPRPDAVASPRTLDMLERDLADAVARGDDASGLALARSWLAATTRGPQRLHAVALPHVVAMLTAHDDAATLATLQADAPPERALLLQLALAKALQTTDPDGAIDTAAAAAELAGSAAEQSRQRLVHATLLFYRQRDDEAYAVADGIDPRELRPEDHAEYLRFLGQKAMVQGDAEAADEALARAEAYARSQELPARVVVTLLATRAVVAYHRPDLPLAERLYLEAIEAFGGPESPAAAQTMMNLAYLWLKTGRVAEARALLDVLLPVTRRAAMPRPLAYALLARWACAEDASAGSAWFAEGLAGVRRLGLWSADFELVARAVLAEGSAGRAVEARELLVYLSSRDA